MRCGPTGHIVDNMKVCAFDRMVMWLFALVDLLSLILAIVYGALALNERNHATNPATCPSGVDTKAQFLMAVGWAVGLTSFALVSLLAVSAYYTLGRLLMWTGTQSDMVRHAQTMATKKNAHMEVALAPTRGDDGGCRILLKMINIAVGALGIVAITAAVILFGGGAFITDYLTWSSSSTQTKVSDYLDMAMGWASLGLVLKLLEALLGHLWAINLSNHRDRLQTMRDHGLGLDHAQSLAEYASGP